MFVIAFKFIGLSHEFQEIWKHGPFSHVTLSIAQRSADDIADYLERCVLVVEARSWPGVATSRS